MKKTDLVQLMQKLGIAPSKKLGQNFLVDDQFLDWIIRYADVQEGENILEIGPGFGALTERMIAKKANLTAIEFDRKLAEYLRGALVPKGLKLIEGDACKVKMEQVFGSGNEFRVISNLPYSAGTIVTANLLDLELPPKEMIIMLQKEVALRFAAQTGSDDYSALTARLALVYDSAIAKTISGDLFYPKPEIDSCIIRLTRKEVIPTFAERKMMSQLARTAFAHRRKKMFKQTAAVFGADRLTAAMNAAGVDPDIRAEKVTPEEFLLMAKELLKSAE